ncbi:MAG: hypothetical protein M0009_12085 [Deltaproteobacteria bacterium]|nr:hypothetical protein [Deltaproteobacteria bacterium]
MKKHIIPMLTVLFFVSVMAPAAHAATVVAPSSCKTYAIVSVYAETNRQTKIGEQVAWPNQTAQIPVSRCPKSIVVISNKNYGDNAKFFYPTQCNTITITITDSDTACNATMSEQ